MATTTRRTPASISAGAHGGVLPKCEQGSSVRYAVAPRARLPATVSASTSACAPPKRRCHPSPTTPSSVASTQPTIGLGSTNPWPRRASSKARDMKSGSSIGGSVASEISFCSPPRVAIQRMVADEFPFAGCRIFAARSRSGIGAWLIRLRLKFGEVLRLRLATHDAEPILQQPECLALLRHVDPVAFLDHELMSAHPTKIPVTRRVDRQPMADPFVVDQIELGPIVVRSPNQSSRNADRPAERNKNRRVLLAIAGPLF